MDAQQKAIRSALWTPLIFATLVILIVVVVHHYILIEHCTQQRLGGQQPPYAVDLRILNATDKKVNLKTLKINKDPMNASSTDPSQPGWEDVGPAFSPPMPPSIDLNAAWFTVNPGNPEPVYGVYAEVELEGMLPVDRLLSGLPAYEDAHVTIVVEKIDLDYRIVLSVAGGFDPAGSGALHWDDN